MAINLDALELQAEAAQITATAEFTDLTGSAYAMLDGDRPAVGISFVYTGGKFSCPCPIDLAQGLVKRTDGKPMRFASVAIEIVPTSFGREKRAGFRALDLVRLVNSAGQEIYRRDRLATEKPKKGAA